jgi:hypothetical protein
MDATHLASDRRVCRICSVELPPRPQAGAGGRNKVHCSDRCRKVFQCQQAKGRRHARPKKRAFCRSCGDELSTYRGGGKRTVCLRCQTTCPCGQRKAVQAAVCRACYWVQKKEDQRRAAFIKHGRICEGCGIRFIARKESGAGSQRAYNRFHSKECRHAHAVRQQRTRNRARAEKWRQRPCLHCHLPMGKPGPAQVHASCRAAYYTPTEQQRAEHRAYSRARQRRIRPGAIHVQRNCVWCEKPFITRNARSSFCTRRCVKRFNRVREKHGLSRSTDPEIIRCRRLLGEAYFTLQKTGGGL